MSAKAQQLIDARRDHHPTLKYQRELLDRAARACAGDPRNMYETSFYELARRMAVSRRRLTYLKAGVRRVSGREIPVRMSFGEQQLLEAIAGVKR